MGWIEIILMKVYVLKIPFCISFVESWKFSPSGTWIYSHCYQSFIGIVAERYAAKNEAERFGKL